MTEITQQSLITTLINKGNELIVLAKAASIYRASVAYVVQHVHSFLVSIKAISSEIWTNERIVALRQVQELFNHFGSLLPHLSVDKWIQPALNWPADYVHKYIDGFRQNLMSQMPLLGLNVADVFQYDEAQEAVNKKADLQSLRSSLEALMANVDTTDAVGVQQQIETKIMEIKRLLPQDSKRRNISRRPSCESLPIIQMQKRVEELLGQFKNIHIPVEDIDLQVQIGAGGFGTVFKATRLSTAEVVAVKELRKDRLTMSSWASLYAEVETMASVRHAFVLELVGAHITQPYRIITRFCPGKSLFDRLHRFSNSYPQLSETDLTRIAYEVAVGMSHLHSMNIVHRDLKTLNILLDEYNDGRVADFGLSGMMKDNQELAGGVGTPHYTAPEVLMHSRYGPKVDTFSYGVVLWEMLMRKVPYSEMSQMQIYEHVVTRGWRLPIPNDTPEGLKKMITRCWNKNPNDRPNFSEIVLSFEKGEINFPQSEPIDFETIKKIHRCPPLDFDYCLKVLTDPRNDRFSSVAYFVCSNIDEKVRQWLRDNKIVSKLVGSKTNIDSILLLASESLLSNEFEGFINGGGLEMFKLCVETPRSQQMSAALRFGLKIPQKLLGCVEKYLEQIVSFLGQTTGYTNKHILQFLTKFSQKELSQYVPRITDSIVHISADVDDQQTFDAIVKLTELCLSSLNSSQLHSINNLLKGDFVVPQSFVQTLIQANDSENYSELLYNILKANRKSDLSEACIRFLSSCSSKYPSVFKQLSNVPDLFQTLQELIEQGQTKVPLFCTFCISGIEENQLSLSSSTLLTVILQMKTNFVQRLQIFTILCSSEDFCTRTTHIDGILRLLISSLSDKSLLSASTKLIGAFSSHQAGCLILIENGVLELFAQLFLSSTSGDTSTSHAILRNIALQGGEIPQVSLIVSCLMQDMISDSSRVYEILETLIALVDRMPSCVQEHDIQKIILPYLNSDQPKLINLALKLLAVADTNSLRVIFPQIIRSIYIILETPKLMYPEIIINAVDTIRNLSLSFDLSDFLKKSELKQYITNVSSLMSPLDERKSNLVMIQSQIMDHPIKI